jgi:hypothetical protein
MFIHQIQYVDDYFLYLWPNAHPPFHLFDVQMLKFGYIHYVFIPEEKELRILYVFVCSDLRKSGYGTYMMKKLLEEIQKEMIYLRFSEIQVLLDDVSERFGKTNNIYLKFGFQYLEQDENGPLAPEMRKVLKITF